MFVIDGDFTPPCASNPELFFSSKIEDVVRAKNHCKFDCKIQLLCLYQALDFERLAGERMHGIHGGLTEAERANTTLTRLA